MQKLTLKDASHRSQPQGKGDGGSYKQKQEKYSHTYEGHVVTSLSVLFSREVVCPISIKTADTGRIQYRE